MSKIAIIGATGRAGSELLEEAPREGVVSKAVDAPQVLVWSQRSL